MGFQMFVQLRPFVRFMAFIDFYACVTTAYHASVVTAIKLKLKIISRRNISFKHLLYSGLGP